MEIKDGLLEPHLIQEINDTNTNLLFEQMAEMVFAHTAMSCHLIERDALAVMLFQILYRLANDEGYRRCL